MVLKMINIVDVDVNCLKRGSCEHHDCLSSSSCRKVEEEEFEIQHNKKQALECERERNIIIIDDDDIPSTCIDDTTTSTTTSTIITPKQQQQQQHQPSPRSSHASRVQVVSIIKKAKNKKVVRFTSECENVVYGYPRPTKDEKIDMYMSKDDYKNIIMTVVEGMYNNNNNNNKKQESNNDNNSEDTDTDNDNELCIECILVQQNSDRIERVKSAISIILQRQKEQKYQKQMMTMTRNIHMNIIDDDSVLAIPVDDDDDDDDDYEIWLDKFYRQPYSKLSSKLARNRGLCDQELILSSLSPRTIVMTR